MACQEARWSWGSDPAVADPLERPRRRGAGPPHTHNDGRADTYRRIGAHTHQGASVNAQHPHQSVLSLFRISRDSRDARAERKLRKAHQLAAMRSERGRAEGKQY